ncbi:hypothetical protein MN116_001381 [Schistosoma mekongi]|uniref:Uncharacterized protein n=1 Tax=Schistosoma mekongi TaxID=38744 RepID=A0AAE1ZL87_SCHME|nr:hypothetical protein MN116_001381 [Schistosoma mekongi]
MMDSHSNIKNVCELPSSPSKRPADRPLGGIALFGPGNEVFGEMKSRFKLKSPGHSDTKESSSEIPTNLSGEQQESSYDNTSSSMSLNSSPRSSMLNYSEHFESKTVSDILLKRARKPPTRKPTLRCRSDNPDRQSLDSSSVPSVSHSKISNGLTEFFNSNS